MKNKLSLILAGMFGGLITLGGSKLLEQPTQAIPSVYVATNTSSGTSNAGNFTLANNNTNTNFPKDFSEAADNVMPAVVNITSITEYKPRNEEEDRYYKFFGAPSPSQSAGSGVVLNKQGYIVTNNHVIEDATKVEVTLYDKRKYTAEVIGTDPSTDLAVLKIEAPDLQTIQMANSDNAKIGEWVLAVGNPFELSSTVTAGIISAKGRNINILSGRASIESFIQTDAAVNPGNSGGALVNTKGELLGINTAIATPTGTYAGYSFAVPTNLVKKVVQDLIDFGEVKRGFLGVMINDLNPDLVTKYDLETSEGVFVNELMNGGGAQAAGMEEGDVIIRVNNIRIKSVPELQEQIASRNPGDAVQVVVLRRNKEIALKIVLKD
ncbi:MAG: trypsin-like peptidase domain-containing protein [Saprospiraceae bacterium]|nr:trypsin-like peptidase domain-containing protein [Saprospiraceae bacterium]